MLDMQDLKLKQGKFNLSVSVLSMSPKIYALIGPSGSGKSTLLAALAGFIPISVGTLPWKRKDITALKPAERPIAILFQDNNLLPI